MIEIQKATLNNIDAIQQLYIQLFALMSNYQPTYYQKAEQNRDFLIDIIGNDDFGVLVAKDDDQILGFIIIQQQNTPSYTCLVQYKLAYVMDIVVDANARGKGVGKQLLDAAERWGQARSVDYLELGVLEENTAAKQLYEREGYSTTSQTMRKRLN